MDNIKIVSQKPAAAESKKSTGLGVFGEDEEDAVYDDQSPFDINASKVAPRDMRGEPKCTISGRECRAVTLASLAYLMEINSPFINFKRILTDSERAKLQKFATATKALTEKQQQECDALAAKAAEENAQFKNPFLDVLKFFVIHSMELTDSQIEELVFDDPKGLRSEALAIGRELGVDNLESISTEIGQAIEDAKSTEVIPSSKETAERGNE